MKKRLVSFWKGHRKISILILLTIIILLFLFGTQAYLYIHFLLGNNVVVKLDVSPQLVKITRGETDSIKIKASITTNPFCSAACSLHVVNLATDETLLQEDATLRPGLNLDREIQLSAPEKGHGSIPLRIELQCHGVQSFLCHTDGKLTTRNLLVIEEYNLSSEELQLKQNITGNFTAKIKIITGLEQNLSQQVTALKEINDSLETESMFTQIQEANETYNNILAEHQQYRALWLNEEYNQLNSKQNQFPFEQQTAAISATLTKLQETILTYDEDILKMEHSATVLTNLSNNLISNKDLLAEIQLLIQQFNTATEQFNNRTSFSLKQSLAQGYEQKTAALQNKTSTQNDLDALSLAVKSKIIAAILCQEKGTCISTPSITNLSTESPADLSSSCTLVHQIQVAAATITPPLQQDAASQNYPNNDEFIETIKTLSNNAQQEQINILSSEITQNAPNTILLQQLLLGQRPVKTKEYPQYDLNPAVLLKVLENISSECELAKPGIAVLPITAKKTTALNNTPTVEPILSFPEPPAQCCVNGICQVCCTEASCRENASYYPIIFLHGHAFNKDASFEYSLDAFNGIQQKLEQDGYLSAGAVSLYTQKDLPLGEFGLFNIPLSIKASYYVDFFQTPENYVTVQTKSENIDVYALRLKEIMDTIKYQTGRPKVIIVAHSMGGLVARRYLQIFGSGDVAKLITIGTPHQGVQGGIASYCDVIGEQRECSDMNSDSVFMNKLTHGGLPTIPVTTIIGTGCEMDGEQGDGVVTESAGQLLGAKKLLINGTCTTFAPLHTEMLDVNSYPEVYEDIKKEIKNK